MFVFFLIALVCTYFLLHTSKNQSVSLPNQLNPIVKERSNQLIQQAGKKGIVVVITEGFRSVQEQNRLYAEGRTTAGKVVTNAKGGESYHNYGLAIDFAIKTPAGKIIWDMNYDGNKNGKPDWIEVVQMAKSLGFQWGGDWKAIKDYSHLQMDFGLTIAQLQNGERPNKSTISAMDN